MRRKTPTSRSRVTYRSRATRRKTTTRITFTNRSYRMTPARQAALKKAQAASAAKRRKSTGPKTSVSRKRPVTRKVGATRGRRATAGGRCRNGSRGRWTGRNRKNANVPSKPKRLKITPGRFGLRSALKISSIRNAAKWAGPQSHSERQPQNGAHQGAVENEDEVQRVSEATPGVAPQATATGPPGRVQTAGMAATGLDRAGLRLIPST